MQADDEQGLWMCFAAGASAEKIVERIEQHDAFTTVVTNSEIEPKTAELVVVSLIGEFADYLGIARAGRLVATDQRIIEISNLTSLESLPAAQIESKLPDKLRNSYDFIPYITSRYSPGRWKSILAAIESLRPRVSESLLKSRQMIDDFRLARTRQTVGWSAFERDAVAISLETWAGRDFRKRILRSASVNRDLKTVSFLSRLRSVSIREDVQIGHDHITFPGLEIAARHQVGAVVLANRGEQLTIINANRQPLEQTLGVDLIYYNHTFDSFVMVQYKRLLKRSNGDITYKPHSDASHRSEMIKMMSADNAIQKISTKAARKAVDYRLSSRPFFIKLCEARSKEALEPGMISGMYLPLHLWRQILKSPESKGKRGGVQIGRNNCARRLNNSEFTTLLRRGWIGTVSGQSAYLAHIIENVLASGRMLVLAATSASTADNDPRRDQFGRYATNDDVLASH